MNGNISILLEVVDKGSAELQKFQANLERTKTQVLGLAKNLGVAGAAMAGAAAAGVAAMVKAGIDLADAMGEAAERAGVSTESFSALAYAAKMSGSSMEGVEAGLTKLSNAIIEAQNPTSEMANAFKALGVSTVDTEGKLRKADEVFRDIAERFKNAPAGPEKTAIAMQIFGKAGADLIPMLNSGKAGLEEFRKEAEELGLVLDTQTTANAGAFNDTIDKLGLAVTGMGIKIGKELTPTLEVLANEFTNARKEGSAFSDFARGVGIVFREIVKISATAINNVVVFGKGLGALAAAGAAALSGDFKAIGTILNEYKSDVNALNASNEAFKKSVDASANAVVNETKATADNNKGKEQAITYRKKNTEAANKESDAFKKALESLLKEADGYKDLTAVQKVNQQIREGAYKNFSEEHKKELLATAEKIDANRRLTNTITAQARVSDSLAMTRLPDSINVADAQERLNLLLSSGEDLSADKIAVYTALAAETAKAYADLMSLGRQIETAKALNQQKVVEQLKAEYAAQEKLIKQQRDGRGERTKQIIVQQGLNREAQNFTELIDNQRESSRLLAEKQEQVVAWYQKGVISAQEYAVAMERIRYANFDLVKQQLTEVDKKATEMATSLRSAFSDTFFDMMQGNFKNLGDRFKKLIDRMVADALAAQLAKALFGDFMQSGKVSGAAGNALSSIASGFMSMFRAGGGTVASGTPYIVGEIGPELFVPKTSGTIIPANVTAAMAGGAANNLTVNVTAMDSQSVLAAMDKIKRPLAEMMVGTSRTYNLGVR